MKKSKYKCLHCFKLIENRPHAVYCNDECKNAKYPIEKEHKKDWSAMPRSVRLDGYLLED